jgi:hypothetical protein
MIVYSACAQKAFVALPGELVVYGTSEQEPQGFGEVQQDPRGRLLVNGVNLETISRKYPWLRKV